MRRVQNYTPASFANPSSMGQKRKRAREHFSCELCRSRKVACDRQQPCENCVKLKCPDECHYDGRHGSKSSETSPSATAGLPSHSDLSATNARVARLENLVERLAGKVGVDVESLRDGSPHTTEPAPQLSTRSERSSHANALLVHSKGYDGLFYSGQHSWSHPASLEMKFFWVKGEEFFAEMVYFNELRAQFDQVRRKTLWDFAILPNPEIAPEQDLLNLIPERQICDTMVSRFLLTFNAVLPLVDPKNLQQSVEKFWVEKRPETLNWLALYLSIIALGYQLPVTTPTEAQFDSNGRRTGSKIMESVIPHAIRIAHRTRRPNLATFQTIILFIFHEKLTLDWVDGNDITNGYLGILSRMAVTMGLHRDPQNFSGMDHDEMDTRRKVFWTFTLIDLEHVLQSGMPCRYRDDGHDVDPPQNASEGWSAYMQRIIDCIPSCEKVIRLSHSRHIQVSRRDVEALADNHRHLTSLGAHRAYPDENTPEHNVICAVQRSMYSCLNDRIQIIVQWPLLDSKERAIKDAVENRMLESCANILENVEWLTVRISKTPIAAQEAWTHFSIAVLRCSLYYAISIVLLFARCRQARNPNSDHDEQMDHLKHLAHEALLFVEKSTPMSFNAAKGQLICWAHYHTIAERADAQGSEDIATGNIDLDSPAGRRVAEATKQVMKNERDRALAAIEEARNMSNPYSALLEAPRTLNRPDETTNKCTENVSDNVPLEEADMFDWPFTFDGWNTGPEMFEDLLAPWT